MSKDFSLAVLIVLKIFDGWFVMIYASIDIFQYLICCWIFLGQICDYNFYYIFFETTEVCGVLLLSAL